MAVTSKGFFRPTTTPTLDEIFDVWLSQLTGSELKVLLYIVRRTFGFKKDADRISLTQICEGIITREGKVLDRGTGLSRTSASRDDSEAGGQQTGAGAADLNNDIDATSFQVETPRK
jgi:hypothetical protein